MYASQGHGSSGARDIGEHQGGLVADDVHEEPRDGPWQSRDRQPSDPAERDGLPCAWGCPALSPARRARAAPDILRCIAAAAAERARLSDASPAERARACAPASRACPATPVGDDVGSTSDTTPNWFRISIGAFAGRKLMGITTRVGIACGKRGEDASLRSAHA